MDEIAASARIVQNRFKPIPETAIVLGSGLQEIAQAAGGISELAWSELPGFPIPTVPGHQSRIIKGVLGNEPLLLLCGRLHYYEGWSMEHTGRMMRILHRAGVRKVLFTNASGAITPDFIPGDLMLIEDHINFMGMNPLRPSTPGSLPQFVDLTEVYDRKLNERMEAAALRCGVKLRKGIYIAVSGPTYETPAEIRAFRTWGADAVGMSTVPEALVARSLGMRVTGLACITNMAAGLHPAGLNHEDVIAAGRGSSATVLKLLNAFFEKETV